MDEKSLYDDQYFYGTRNDPRRVIAYQQDAEKIRKRVPLLRNVLDIG